MKNSGLILVVDDTLSNLEVMSEALEDVGYEVATAIDGERALKRVQTHPPDLILLDVQMPGIDGFETCRRLKSDPVTASIPVIFMTALSDTNSKVKGFAVGAVDYITKPFQTEETLARISTHLQLRYLSQYLELAVAERTAALKTTIEQLHQTARDRQAAEMAIQQKSRELEQALQELQQAQLQIVQNEKMSALGNLVAGVAHEINNPLSCIVGNVSAVQDYINDLLGLIDIYSEEFPQPPVTIEDELKAIDLNYLRSDLPKLIRAMKEGGSRITSLSKSLRTFSRADSDEKQLFNLHEGIDSTILILRHRLKANDTRPAIEVVTDYGKIPDIDCFPGQLNQVFMNLLANAIDSLEETNQGLSFAQIKTNPNTIAIKTQFSEETGSVTIAIKDNGKGMSESVKSKIFDHLFTTKAVGKGTGLGLSISRQIVEEMHGGSLTCHSVLAEGTEFAIVLPLV